MCLLEIKSMRTLSTSHIKVEGKSLLANANAGVLGIAVTDWLRLCFSVILWL